MRARHRHFNPKAAGAIAAYDARFISASDGDAISTWTSLTGANDATQATSANRPSYETNEINGAPAVLFNGSVKQLEISITIPTDLTVVSVTRRGATARSTGVFGTNSAGTKRFSAYLWTNNEVYTNYNVQKAFGAPPILTGNFILSETKVGTTSNQVYQNGSSWRAALTGTTSSSSFTRLGYSEFGVSPNHLLARTCLLDIAASDALRKRLEHAAAFSFKISCN